MSRLNELIQELCPDGVEFKKIHDVAEVGTGCCNGNEAEDGGVYPFFVRSQNVKAKNDFQYDEEAIIIPGEGGIGDIFHYVNGKYALHQRVYRIHFIDKTINAKFIYYYMKSNFKSFILKKAVSATVTSIRKPMIEKFEIPIPPLDVQNEIVSILDTFTSHTAELQAELQARKEQYEYYRNKLLTFDKDEKNVKWMKLGEVGTFIRGKRFVRTDIVENGIPCIHYGDMYTFYGLKATKTKGMLRKDLAAKMRFAQKNDVVIVAAGENKDDIGVGLAWLGEEPVAVHDACFIFKSKMYPQYVAHFLRTDYYHKQIKKYVSEAKICSISAKGLAKTIIPVPTFEKQQHISSILDKFEALVNDLTEGIPAEIAAVQEQYEYYRNKLLSFPKIKES